MNNGLIAALGNATGNFCSITYATAFGKTNISSIPNLIKPNMRGCNKLFAHLAVERYRFNMAIANTLLEELVHKYPRLMRTTQQAPLEQQYDIHFSPAEVGLIAISFRAWLIQGHASQEKQLLLTLDNPQLEEPVAYQQRKTLRALRENH